MAAAMARSPPTASVRGDLFIVRRHFGVVVALTQTDEAPSFGRFMSQIDRTLAEAARAWPFEEARKLVKRIAGKTPAKGYVLFETGYGPSGLPHIGTFGEVVRTTMVRRAVPRL